MQDTVTSNTGAQITMPHSDIVAWMSILSIATLKNVNNLQMKMLSNMNMTYKITHKNQMCPQTNYLLAIHNSLCYFFPKMLRVICRTVENKKKNMKSMVGLFNNVQVCLNLSMGWHCIYCLITLKYCQRKQNISKYFVIQFSNMGCLQIFANIS